MNTAAENLAKALRYAETMDQLLQKSEEVMRNEEGDSERYVVPLAADYALTASCYAEAIQALYRLSRNGV